MKKKLIILIVLISSIFASETDDTYEKLINETVSEEYCNAVISNITKLIKELYIYSDFYKSPISPKADEIYTIEPVDLIKELEAIPTKDRKFYEFIRDIYKIQRKTRDGHLGFLCTKSPSGISLQRNLFMIPYSFDVADEFDDEGNRNDTYLFIKNPYSRTSTQNVLNDLDDVDDNFILPFIKKRTLTDDNSYYNKKIISINGENPFEFIANFYGDFKTYHSSQANYVQTLRTMKSISLLSCPFLKEELQNITIVFDDHNELILNYEFENIYNLFSVGFADYYLSKQNQSIIEGIPIENIDIETIYKEYKQQNNINNKKFRKTDEAVEWDYSTAGMAQIKCKIDDDNKVNVLYQNSFSPNEFVYKSFEGVMLKCLNEFYSNDYPIIIIESNNKGGYASLCFPMAQYLRPKILGTALCSTKNTDISYESIISSFVLNNETCKPYDNREKFNRETVDNYDNGVIHNRTKEFEYYTVYSKKDMEKNRRKYISSNHTKKPTEIIVYTDGYSFSCASILIKGLQVYGSAIIVGYNAKPDITSKDDFDASLSNSAVKRINNEYTNNLNNLSFNAQVTLSEQFDPNDIEEPKIPMEFKKYPVDELSDIHTNYKDEYYNRFITNAKEIFKKYNENMECNPKNSLLFYETEECDSLLEEHGHGGYICNENGKWDKNNCVLKYCDVGYILDIKNKKCIKDPCEDIEIINKTLTCDSNFSAFDIKPNQSYTFIINDSNNQNCSLYFYSELDNYFYVNSTSVIKNGTQLVNGSEIYTNIYLNNTENVHITISKEKIEEKANNSTKSYFRGRKINKKNSLAGILLVSILVPIVAISILIGMIIMTKKTIPKVVENPTTQDSFNKFNN